MWLSYCVLSFLNQLVWISSSIFRHLAFIFVAAHIREPKSSVNIDTAHKYNQFCFLPLTSTPRSTVFYCFCVKTGSDTLVKKQQISSRKIKVIMLNEVASKKCYQTWRPRSQSTKITLQGSISHLSKDRRSHNVFLHCFFENSSIFRAVLHYRLENWCFLVE